jgi:hypothetical protein
MNRTLTTNYPTPIANHRARPPVVDLMLWADARPCEGGLAGDVEAAIAWLHKHGGPEWREAIDRVNTD